MAENPEELRQPGAGERLRHPRCLATYRMNCHLVSLNNRERGKPKSEPMVPAPKPAYLLKIGSVYVGDDLAYLLAARQNNDLDFGATQLRFDTNIGFLKGCNAALPSASADFVLLLNNDVELAPGAVAAALHRLASDPAIGAVGGKVIRTHGLLQEAGNIIWRDGVTSGYLRDASPLAPEANFVRDVDFCSGVFLML